MNKMLLGMVLIAVCSWLLSPIAWWIFALPSTIIPFLLAEGDRKSFFMSFFAIGLLNLVCIGITTIQNDGILAAKIGAVFQGLPGIGIVILSILLPAFLAGLCGWSAAALRHYLRHRAPSP